MKRHDHVDCRSGGKEHHHCSEAGRLRSKLEKAVYGNVVLLGVLSIVWLLLRSARKPSRLNYPCQRAALANTVATETHSDRPIVAERSMLWPVAGGRAGHATQGMTAPASAIFMPEGCTAYGFDTWLLVANPGDVESDVTVYAMTGGGERKITEFKLAADKRKTVRLNDFFQGNLSIRVAASSPVSAERAVYWNNRTGGTCSIGYSK